MEDKKSKESENKDLKHLFRIISMDGGGIYGLFTVLMLKKLCNSNPNFLKEGCVNLFAGTSAGALNALLFAKHKNPRDAIECGEMERFWSEPMMFANVNPFTWFLSNLGWMPYLGTEEYYSVLNKYFGNLTLGELNQNVLITVFNWAGKKYPGRNKQWTPKVIDNYNPENPDCKYRVVDVAFASTSPTFLRAMYHGGNDGGLFAPNPTMSAITKVVQESFRSKIDTDIKTTLNLSWEDMFKKMHKNKNMDKGSILDHLSVFSVGTGIVYPYLPVGELEEWGMWQWMMGSWNPEMKDWVLPMMRYQFEPAIESVNFQARQLLNRAFEITVDGKPSYTYKEKIGYCRLSPEVLKLSMTFANMILRNNPIIIHLMIADIYKAADKPECAQELAVAHKWLENEYWFNPKGWTSDLHE